MSICAMETVEYKPISAQEVYSESENYKPIQVRFIKGEIGNEYLLIKKSDCATTALLLRKQDAALDRMDVLKEENIRLHNVSRNHEKTLLNQSEDIENRDKTIRSLKRKIKSLEKKLNRTKDELETAIKHGKTNLETLNLIVDYIQERDSDLSSSAHSSRSSSLTASPLDIFSGSN